MIPARLPLVEGVELRLLEVEHAEAIFATVEANRKYLREWLPWVDPSRDASFTRGFLVAHIARREEGQAAGYGLWRGDAVLGVAGLHEIELNDRHCALGYWLAEAEQGRGLMTQTVRLLLSLAFRHFRLERVEILCAVGNDKSAAIPQRIGLHYEGLRRHAQRLQGRYVDLRVYSLLSEEAQALGL